MPGRRALFSLEVFEADLVDKILLFTAPTLGEITISCAVGTALA